jgi:hypothetical protein
MQRQQFLGEHNPLTPFSKGELPTHFEKEPVTLTIIISHWLLSGERKVCYPLEVFAVRPELQFCYWGDGKLWTKYDSGDVSEPN